MVARGLQVEVLFEATQASGREAAPDLSGDGYRSLASAGAHAGFDLSVEHFGILLKSGPSRVVPGESVTAQLFALVHEPAIDELLAAGVFTVFEPPHVVARGRVLGVIGGAV